MTGHFQPRLTSSLSRGVSMSLSTLIFFMFGTRRQGERSNLRVSVIVIALFVTLSFFVCFSTEFYLKNAPAISRHASCDCGYYNGIV